MCKQFGNHNVGAMTRRVGKWIDRATPEQIQFGKTWYLDARIFAGELAQDSPYTLEQVAHVIAALSPQCDWGHNMDSAARLVKAHAAGERTIDRYPGYKTNMVKGFDILDGDLTVLRGPKVTAFKNAILGDMSLAVIDVWASRTARDKETNLAYAFRDDETPGRVEMRAMQEAYRRAAAARGMAPGEAQASAWLCIKESGEWVRPQHMPGKQAPRFYARHISARKRLGLTIHTRAGYWGLATNGLAAALAS
jgi:hypothetical protein